MKLSNEERRFLVKRARLVQSWRYVGAILMAMLIGLGLWLFFSKPLLANPFVVLSRIKSGSLPESMLPLMASMLPIVVLLCLVIAIVAVLFVYAAFSNEKKYLMLIQRDCPDTMSEREHG
jgi:hypothetical protein